MDGTIARIPVDPATDRKKGFGFIKAEDGDYFFHASDVTGTKRFGELNEGDKCTFTPTEGTGKGPRAVDVRVA